VRLTPLSLCEASTAAVKAWGCWDSESAPEILALTVKRHTTARTVSTRRTAAVLRLNWYSLPNSTRTLPDRVKFSSSPWGVRCHDGPLYAFIIYLVLDCTAVVFASTSAAGSGIAPSVFCTPSLRPSRLGPHISTLGGRLIMAHLRRTHISTTS